MANINSTSLTGNIVRDIELKTTANGTNVANATIAVSDYKDNTSFIDLVFFGKTAEVANKYLSKGSATAITGRLQQRSYETKDGSKRSVVEVIVDNLQLPRKGDGASQSGSGDAVADDINVDEPVSLDELPF